MITVIAGGVGAARFLRGLVETVDPTRCRAIVNVGDDLVLHGLHISPDIDTCIYTVADAIDPERGWGLVDETWRAMEALGRYGGENWFSLGDQDLATHLHRTQRLREGATLTEVTGELARAWGLDLTILPVTDDELRTHVSVPGEGELSFQQYFVGRQHAVPIDGVRFAGEEAARPGPDVLASIRDADVVVIAPSNPIVSIGPVLAVPGVREALAARREQVVAISPIIGGQALKGPAADMLSTLGHEVSAVGIARLYAELAETLVLDDADADLAAAVAGVGVRPLVRDTIMSTPERSAALAAATIAAGSDR
ncbi:MAG: 2-phospho-L-lactate transferase [Actinomycetota bacterium]